MAAHQGYLYSVPQFDFEDAVKPGGYGAPGIGDYDHDPSERQERADTEGPHYTLNSLSWREPAGTTSRHSPPGKEKDAEGKDVSLVDLENALKEKRMLEDRSQREKDAIQRRIDSITSRLGSHASPGAGSPGGKDPGAEVLSFSQSSMAGGNPTPHDSPDALNKPLSSATPLSTSSTSAGAVSPRRPGRHEPAGVVCGVGMTFTFEGGTNRLVVCSLVPPPGGMYLDPQPFAPGDTLVEVNGSSVEPCPLVAPSLLWGEPGTPVRLSMRSPDVGGGMVEGCVLRRHSEADGRMLLTEAGLRVCGVGLVLEKLPGGG
eukprot:CAMPEP_0172060616 /NCGR_PEP_ID=MMETSP1043-20130122/8048_1 /TAXON_ID=464988 /ORGANISM="Hemiselmis andersenii, Strain CCMP441" /LENGTH=315 /DNA_ID=CAMNT_0012720371 /DNA_START=63 /DNA_END=1006 /DNA_ORIENTATION=-